MARKAIKKEELKKLCILSKNICAFPGCQHKLINEKNEYIAELCHIEAAEPGGPRYNNQQSDDERNSADNLMFLCHKHHVETHNQEEYSVDKLKKMKGDHEKSLNNYKNYEDIIEKVIAVFNEQENILRMIKNEKKEDNYPLYISEVNDYWTPEDGRFYEIESDGFVKKYIVMMKKGWLHIEQVFEDDAIAYYELNNEGQVRNIRMPYPINEYRVEIQEDLITNVVREKSVKGNYAVKTNLKWNLGYVIVHYGFNNEIISIECNARHEVKHKDRLFYIFNVKSDKKNIK